MHMFFPATVVSAWLSGSQREDDVALTCMMLRPTRVAMTFRSDSIVRVGRMFRSDWRPKTSVVSSNETMCRKTIARDLDATWVCFPGSKTRRDKPEVRRDQHHQERFL
jgi:hypothetical protein